MDSCKHIWQGHRNGVTCTLCGKQMTHEEYVAMRTPAKPKPAKKRSEKK